MPNWISESGGVVTLAPDILTLPANAQAYPIGAVFIAVVATNPATLLGYGTWSAFGAGRVLVGLNSGDTDFDVAEETGGAKTNTPSAHAGTAVGTSGAGSSHVHTGPSHQHNLDGGAAITHTHPYTDIVNHTHSVPVNSAFTGGSSGYGQDTSVNGSLTSGNPAGGVATGTTQANNTGGKTDNAGTGNTGAEAAHTHASGAVTQPNDHSALSVVQPYIVVYMWKRVS